MQIGRELKRIRQNRDYTQAYVAKDILSQSAYSKFEARKSDISTTTYLHLLDRLHITPEEVGYIKNDYQYEESQRLVTDFFALPYNKVSSLQQLLAEFEAYLHHHDNRLLADIKLICKALILLQEANNLEQIREMVEPVWNRLSRHHQWYLDDIRLMNVILFLFPTDVALEVTKRVLTRLAQYNGFRDSSRLKLTFQMNLSLLLIKSEDYAESLEGLTALLEKNRKDMPYSLLAVCFTRMAICHVRLELGKEKEYMEKAQQLLSLYGDEELWSSVQKEYRYYCGEFVL